MSSHQRMVDLVNETFNILITLIPSYSLMQSDIDKLTSNFISVPSSSASIYNIMAKYIIDNKIDSGSGTNLINLNSYFLNNISSCIASNDIIYSDITQWNIYYNEIRNMANTAITTISAYKQYVYDVCTNYYFDDPIDGIDAAGNPKHNSWSQLTDDVHNAANKLAATLNVAYNNNTYYPGYDYTNINALIKLLTTEYNTIKSYINSTYDIITENSDLNNQIIKALDILNDDMYYFLNYYYDNDKKTYTTYYGRSSITEKKLLNWIETFFNNLQTMFDTCGTFKNDIKSITTSSINTLQKSVLTETKLYNKIIIYMNTYYTHGTTTDTFWKKLEFWSYFIKNLPIL